MIDIQFTVHSDCTVPCLHIVIKQDGQTVTDSEASLSDYINMIPIEKLEEYSQALEDGFQRIIDEVAFGGYYIDALNRNIQNLIAISKRKTEVDKAINPEQFESENE